MVEKLPSLQARVVWASAAVSALVGVLAAGSAAVLVRQQQRDFAEQRLFDAATLFISELGDGEESVAHQLADENEELRPLGMSLAVFEGPRVLGGDPKLSTVSGCQVEGLTLACALDAGRRRVVVVGPDIALPGVRWAFSILLATVLSAAVGALASRAAGTWALRSLNELRRRVAAGDARELGLVSSTAEVEALRATLHELVQRLEAALERSRVFASSAAHELRTPLATLSAELELLSAESPAAKDTAARALRTLRRLSFLVDRLLALAQGELGPQRPFETVALEDVVRDVIVGRSAADQARLAAHVEDAGMVRGDEALLAAVVDNLVDNALKFSDGPVQVRISAEAELISLRVTDLGPGVPPERVSELLKPFARGESGVHGHGLGLAIINRAVELHGGTLRFENSTAVVQLSRWRPGV